MVQRTAAKDEPLALRMRLSVLSDVCAWVGFTLFKLRLRLTPEFCLDSCVERPQHLMCADSTFCDNVYVYPSIQLTKASEWKAVMKWI